MDEHTVALEARIETLEWRCGELAAENEELGAHCERLEWKFNEFEQRATNAVLLLQERIDNVEDGIPIF